MSKSNNRRSSNWYGKMDKDGFIHRSWMKSQGLPDHVFDGRPIIGICNTWSELTPCNAGLKNLAEGVKRGVWEAGGVPLEFPVMSLGETQMKPTAMLFRNLLSMDVEESIRAYGIDGVVLLGGCDKTTPGQLMGAASVDLPTIVVSAGPMLNGKFKGKDIGSGTDVWRFSEEVRAGDIAACIGLKNVTTGDTLSDAKDLVVLERMEFPEPVISLAVEPKSKPDQEKMSIALGKLAQEDPSFRVSSDEESGQTIISGMGELHLEVLVERMKREFSVEANVGKPQVAYREAIKSHVEVEHKYAKQSGGKGQYGHVMMRMEPCEEEFEFVDEIKGGSIPKEYIPAVSKGVQEQLQNGVVAGYPLQGVKVTLYDGSYHEVDSSEMAFKLAGSMAAKDGALKANPVLLEPMMDVEVVTSED